MKKCLISFSGGRTSAFMTWWMMNQWKDRHEHEIIVVFANTGKEREQTLEFVNSCDKEFSFNTVWVESVTNPLNNYGVLAKIVSFEKANRTGEPFEEVIKKHGLPNTKMSHCSRQMKGYCIRAYARSIGWIGKNYKTAIGIRADEPNRINLTTAKKDNIFYPFAHIVRVTKSDVNYFWSKQTFDLNLKSYEGNCDLCWKKSKRKLMTIIKENPSLSEWWKDVESKYENFIPESRRQDLELPLRMYRQKASINDFIEESRLPFEPARDESKDIDMYKQMVLWDDELDGSLGCIESCEAF